MQHLDGSVGHLLRDISSGQPLWRTGNVWRSSNVLDWLAWATISRSVLSWCASLNTSFTITIQALIVIDKLRGYRPCIGEGGNDERLDMEGASSSTSCTKRRRLLIPLERIFSRNQLPISPEPVDRGITAWLSRTR